MKKTFVIPTTLLIAGVMAMSVIMPYDFAKAQQDSFRPHGENHVTGKPLECDIPDSDGLLFYLDLDGDNIHDHDSEPTACLGTIVFVFSQ